MLLHSSDLNSLSMKKCISAFHCICVGFYVLAAGASALSATLVGSLSTLYSGRCKSTQYVAAPSWC
jgi:hypothetical protein